MREPYDRALDTFNEKPTPANAAELLLQIGRLYEQNKVGAQGLHHVITAVGKALAKTAIYTSGQRGPMTRSMAFSLVFEKIVKRDFENFTDYVFAAGPAPGGNKRRNRSLHIRFDKWARSWEGIVYRKDPERKSIIAQQVRLPQGITDAFVAAISMSPQYAPDLTPPVRRRR